MFVCESFVYGKTLFRNRKTLECTHSLFFFCVTLHRDSVEAASIISKLLKLATATPTTKEYPVTASIVVGSGVETRNDTTILHIFAGAPQRLEGTVLYPGSLKDRGDYCLVYLHVVEGEEETFRWQVKNVDFRQMEHGGGGR
jgi:hypothetical protein